MPITEDQADGVIHAFYNEFPGLSGLKISHRPTQESFYGVKASVEAIGVIKGAFLPKRGEIHLPLANFRDAADLRKSLRHEALGHFGTLTFTNPEKRGLLEVIISSRKSPSMAGDWAKVDKAYQGLNDWMKAEEVFCLAAERIGELPTKNDAETFQIWREVVGKKIRLLEREDLQAIVEWVADGLRRGIREQQIFPVDDRSQFGPLDLAIAEAMTADAEQQERDQSAEVDRDAEHSLTTYENELQSHIEAKQQQVERIESRLENLIEQQEARLRQGQQSKPGVLALPRARNAWRELQEEQRARLQGLHARLERVQGLREGMSTHGPKIEGLAARKLRAQKPGLADEWEQAQVRARREQLEQRQITKRDRGQLPNQRGQTLVIGKPE